MAITAADIMTRHVITARPDESVKAVARLLADHDISAVPVCDENGKPIGMVSEGDLMRPFGRDHALRRAWWLNLLAEGHDLAPNFVDYVSADRRTAGDLMTKPVISAADTMTVPELADLIIAHKIKRLPILREGRLVGIVSRSDIVRALAREPGAAIGG
jgi:CBS domain-containing protein